jgi:lipoprotein-anchoring transpeptidase ErfK/SrfK
MAAMRWETARLSLVAAALAVVLTSCALPGTRPVADVEHGGSSSPGPPPRISVSPADRTQGVALDSQVVVSSSSGHLDSVTVTEAGVSGSPTGQLSPDGRSWTLTQALDPGANYTVTAHARDAAGRVASSLSSFSTLTASGRLLTSFTPADGSVVGVGEPIDLSFNTPIPADRRAALLERVRVTSTPGVIGAWHWFSDTSAHFRTQDYWPSGAHVTVAASLKGFDVGGGIWGLGNWSMSFSVGDKHVSVIDDTTHQMQVFNNDQLVNTWPVSMGKSGFATLQGTLVVLYRTYKVMMDSCSTFGGAACIPGAPNYYRDYVYYDTAVSSDGYFIHAAPWSVYAQGHYDVSHGCINLSTARATTFYNYSLSGDVVIVKNTGNPATAADGEGDWQIDFDQFSNSAGLGTVWTGDLSQTMPGGRIT